MDNLENVYNQALEMLKSGHSKEEVLLEFGKFKDQLSPLLDVSLGLLSMPKNPVPQPLMRKKFATEPARNFWLAWLHISRFAVISTSVVLLVSALSVAGYQAYNSLPGNALFGVKKQAEQLQLILAGSQTAKANLQVEIAQKRLSEAQAVFSDPTSNSQQKDAALNELASQTTTAVAEVNNVASTDPKSEANHPLLSSLDTLTQDQAHLLTTITPDNQIATATQSALLSLNQNTQKLTEIKETVAIAAASPASALAQLNNNPNSVAAFGEISTVSLQQITVNQISFVINGQTQIQDPDGNTVPAYSLSPNLKATVIGVKDATGLTAVQILLADVLPKADSSGQVQSASTQQPELDNSSTPVSIIPTSSAESIKKAPENTSNQDATDTPQNSSGTARGSFILENPSPQFIQ